MDLATIVRHRNVQWATNEYMIEIGGVYNRRRKALDDLVNGI